MRIPKGIVKRVQADTPQAIRLFYRGAGTVTSVTVDVSTDIEMITTEGTETYTFADYTTVGALVDAINLAYNNGAGTGVWNAVVVDALRSHPTDDQFVNGVVTVASDEDSAAYYPIKVDTSAAKIVSCAVSGSRFVSATRPDTRVMHFVQAVFFATLGAAGADKVQVYERKANGTETLLLSRASVSATTTTISLGEGYVSGDAGADLIVVLSDGTSISDTALSLEVTALQE